jgi:DNA mismatch repair protein MutL
MPSIQILSDRVANQIAAGEVIERPVAVIKELVENSLDAGATRIEVEFRNGGKAYMRVEDNGRGMTPDEALLCLERHATSKIRSAEDLQEVTSFGFRGEALPSIASVARFTLRTRHESFEHGTEITINGGKLVDKKDCGMPVGTRIEVAQLFNAVPARRKFLKTDATETAHITYNCRLFAIPNPSVHFRVLENGREVFQSPSGLPLRDRIGEIWGRQLATDLISVDQLDEASGLRLTGLTAKPGIGRSTRRELITLVNRRPVDNRTLGFAVLDAYHGHLPKGRYPPAFLFLEISPREMDVNVHPAKREVRFRQEGAVRRFVLAAITTTLEAYRDAQTTAAIPKTKPAEPPAEASTPAATPCADTRAGSTGPAVGAPTAASAEPPGAGPPPLTKQPPRPEPSTPKAKTSNERPPEKAAPAQDRPKQFWRLLSRLKERYALMETPRGLVILHLRQADQRIRYEQILRTFTEKAAVESQGLLIAEPLEFEPLAAEALESNLSLLNEHGFAIEPFGRNFYRIEAVPNWLATEQAESFIRDLVDELRQRGSTSRRESVIWESVAKLAIKESYQRSDPVSTQSIEAMAAGLLECEVPHSSPFGRPTYQEIGWSELERRFGG